MGSSGVHWSHRVPPWAQEKLAAALYDAVYLPFPRQCAGWAAWGSLGVAWGPLGGHLGTIGRPLGSQGAPVDPGEKLAALVYDAD